MCFLPIAGTPRPYPAGSVGRNARIPTCFARSTDFAAGPGRRRRICRPRCCGRWCRWRDDGPVDAVEVFADPGYDRLGCQIHPDRLCWYPGVLPIPYAILQEGTTAQLCIGWRKGTGTQYLHRRVGRGQAQFIVACPKALEEVGILDDHRIGYERLADVASWLDAGRRNRRDSRGCRLFHCRCLLWSHGAGIYQGNVLLAAPAGRISVLLHPEPSPLLPQHVDALIQDKLANDLKLGARPSAHVEGSRVHDAFLGDWGADGGGCDRLDSDRRRGGRSR